MEKYYKFHFRFINTGEIIENYVKIEFDGVKGTDRIKTVNRRFGYFKRSILHFENKWRKECGLLPVDRHEYVANYEEIDKIRINELREQLDAWDKKQEELKGKGW